MFPAKAGGYDLGQLFIFIFKNNIDLILSIGLTRSFKDLKDFQGYIAHADHVAVLKLLGPRVESMVSFQVESKAKLQIRIQLDSIDRCDESDID